MASLGDVGDALRRVLTTIDQSIAAYHQASELAEQARELLSGAGSGSNHADVEQVCACFTRVIEGITEPEGQVSTLATVADEIRSYLQRHGISHETAVGPTPAAAPATPTRQPSSGAAEQVEALRGQLPPPVQSGSGQKTHGRWFTPGSGQAATVATPEIWHDQKPDNDYGPGDPAIIVATQEELSAFIDRGYVRVSGADVLRATQGDPDAADNVVYDFQGHETLVPASYEVPLGTVRAVLAAYLDHGGLIPQDFPHLHEVVAV